MIDHALSIFDDGVYVAVVDLLLLYIYIYLLLRSVSQSFLPKAADPAIIVVACSSVL